MVIMVRILVVIIMDLNLLVEEIFQMLSVKFASFLVMEQIDARIYLILLLSLRKILVGEISEVSMVEEADLSMVLEGA